MQIIIDRLDEEQWQKVRAYLQSEPNKQRIIDGKSYGLYVSVLAKPEMEVNMWSGEKDSLRYREVTFLLHEEDHSHPSETRAEVLAYFNKRGGERKQVKQGLIELLGELLEI